MLVDTSFMYNIMVACLSMYMEEKEVLLLLRDECTNKGAYKEDQYNGLWRYFDREAF